MYSLDCTSKIFDENVLVLVYNFGYFNMTNFYLYLYLSLNAEVTLFDIKIRKKSVHAYCYK